MQLTTSLPPSILPCKCYHQERFWLKRKWKADDFWHLNGDNWDLLHWSAIGVSAKQMERLITVCCEAALIYDEGREEGASGEGNGTGDDCDWESPNLCVAFLSNCQYQSAEPHRSEYGAFYSEWNRLSEMLSFSVLYRGFSFSRVGTVEKSADPSVQLFTLRNKLSDMLSFSAQ